MDKKEVRVNTNTCVSCGKEIPEGDLLCPTCRTAKNECIWEELYRISVTHSE